MKRTKRIAAWILSAVMAVSLLPALPARAEENPPQDAKMELVASYDMSHKDGVLKDQSGNGNDAPYSGFAEENFVVEDGENVLNFEGKKEQYVTLPAGLIEKEAFAIEAVFQAKAEGNSWLFCLGTKVNKWPNVKNYAFFCPAQGNNNNGKQGNVRTGIKDGSSELLLDESMKLDLNQYHTVRYEFQQGLLKVSVDGNLVGERETGYSIQEILKNGTEGDAMGYIGKSLYSPDPTFKGNLKSFKILAETKDHSDAGKLAEAKEALNLPYNETTQPVYGNITLPSTGLNETTITWEETDGKGIVDVEEHANEGYDPTPAGTVTRPAEDTVVTMKATISLGELSDTKEFKFLVKEAVPKLTEEDYTDYFFGYFAGEGYSDGEQIYFAASEDGIGWNDLNGNKPVLTSDKGEKGVRDPFLIRSPEGDKFYMIATDLKINGGNGWGAAQTAGSQSLMVWESNDLVNWSDMRMVEVSASINAGCTWAPEATYDPITGEYIVYWASKTSADNYGKQIVYYAKTRDFYSFTEPKKFIEKNESSIDTTVIYNDKEDMYYRYTKNEGGKTNEQGAKTKSIFIEKSRTLLGEWTPVGSESLNANQWVEGPTIFKFNADDSENDQWCLLVDNFGGIGYYPLLTNDLASGEFTRPDDATHLMPSRARHGTPIRITREEYDAVMAKWGDVAPENAEEEQLKPVLEYDFETVDQTIVTDVSGNGNDAVLNGNAAIKEGQDGSGNALYLDGSNGTFAELPVGFFDGRDTFSISMDVKPEKVDGNFFTFTFGQDSNKYYFLKTSKDSLKSVMTTHSYGREFGFTQKVEELVKDQWLHLTVVMDDGTMKLYLGENLMAEQNDIPISVKDLGVGLKSYLGKSFYENDAYFQGYFDNVKVYNRVLRGVEIAGGVLGDKTELNQLLEEYKNVDGTLYTKDTYEAFQKAYEAAQKVSEDPDALEDAVAEAVRTLKEAYGNLEKVKDPDEGEGQGGQGGQGDQNEGQGGQTGPNGSGNGQGSGSASSGSDKGAGNKAGSVKTGDTAPVAGWAAAFLLAGAAVVVMRKRKKI